MTSPVSDQYLAEYQSLTAGFGRINLNNWSTVSIVGEDRIRFVQNMGTNDVNLLAAGEGTEMFFTDVKGKIVTHVFVLALEDELLLFTVPEQASTIINHLDRYIIREDVKLNDKSGEFQWNIISGAKSLPHIKAWTANETLQLDSPWQHARCLIDSVEVLIVNFPAIWPESYLLRFSNSQASKLQQLLGEPCQPQVWNALRVESALPLWQVDYNSSNLPQEVNRDDQAISFNKGCYLGQETIARIDALGHVNQQLVSLRFDSQNVPRVGTKLLSAQKEVGEVTTACWSPRDETPLALAMVRRGSNETGCKLESDCGQAIVG